MHKITGRVDGGAQQEEGEQSEGLQGHSRPGGAKESKVWEKRGMTNNKKWSRTLKLNTLT